MKLTHLSNQRVIISRLQAYSGGGSKLALSTVTATLGHLEPLAPDKAVLIDGVVGKAYRIFVDGAEDIQDGDQLKDESGAIYTVRKGGVSRWQHGAMDFKEVNLIRS